MLPSRLALPLTLLAAALAVSGLRAQDVSGTCPGGACSAGGRFTLASWFGGCCNNKNCPPPLVHCLEKPPKIKYKCACPRPICEPCQLEHFGYYQTCWCPWPFPPDLRHCPCAGEHPANPYLAPATPPAVPEMPPARGASGNEPQQEPYTTRIVPASDAARPVTPRVEITSCGP